MAVEGVGGQKPQSMVGKPLTQPPPGTGTKGEKTVVDHTTITGFNGEELNNIFKEMPPEVKDRIFSKLSVSQLLLIVGKLNIARKDQEMEKLQDQLQKMYNAIDYLNNEMSKASTAAKKENGKYNWPSTARQIANKTVEGTGTRPNFPTDATAAVDSLSNYSKSVQEKAKELGAKVSQLRTDKNSLTDTLSAIMKAMKEAIGSGYQKMN